MRKMIALLAALAFPGVAHSQAVPGNTAIIEVRGDKTEAMRVLKSNGIRSVELKGPQYTLPSVRLAGPEKIREGGRMVVVTADVDRTKWPEDLVQMKFQWTVLVNGIPNRNTMVWPDGSRIIFDSSDEPSKTTVILDVDCLFGTEKTAVIEGKETKVLVGFEINSSDLVTHVVEVGGGPSPPPTPGPSPPPTPTPGPSPAPDFPPGQFGLSRFAYEALASQTTLTSSERVAVGQALSGAYGGIAAKISAVSTYRNFEVILRDLTAANRAALTNSGVNLAKLDGFKKILGDKFYELVETTKTIADAEGLRIACLEIAAGLREVK